MLLTSTLAINCSLRNFLNKAIGIIDFAKHFQNFIDGCIVYKFYRRIVYDLISKFQAGLKSLLRQGIPEPKFYGDLVYKLKQIVGSSGLCVKSPSIIPVPGILGQVW